MALLLLGFIFLLLAKDNDTPFPIEGLIIPSLIVPNSISERIDEIDRSITKTEEDLIAISKQLRVKEN